MKNLLALAASGLLLLGAAQPVAAQSTDGYHSIQVFPVVVDTAAFAQQFNFTTPNPFSVVVRTRFFPGDATPQVATGPITCNNVTIPANGVITVASLRTLCPALVSGSAFGFLHMQAQDSSDGMYADIPVFAAYSRVSNPQGNGFSVEAFAAHTFTSGTTVVNGLRRLSAGANSPAFQTNCFVANMNQLDPEAGAPVAKPIDYTLFAGGSQYTKTLSLLPGQFVRLLDIYATAGAPAGDYSNNTVVFRAQAGTDRPGLMSFCTVQDNTSFGADFRIGKVAFGTLGIASNDALASRETAADEDVQGRPFEIGSGSSANTHVVYFRHPDTVQCQLLNPVTFAPLTAASGLEMRAADAALTTVVGGNNATSTGMIYTGDKPSHNGYNNRYLIEVESNETNATGVRPYALFCSSGSGSTFGYDIIKYKEAEDRF